MTACRLVVLIAALGVVLASSPVEAQKPTEKPTQPKAEGSQPKMDAMMQEYMKQAAPGEKHKVFAKMAGKWSVVTRVWMDPSRPPMESTGSAEAKLIYDGRFLLTEISGTIMGMPQKIMSWHGYDNSKKVYEYTFISNLGTATFTSSGNFEADGKTLTLKGEMNDMAGKRIVRYVIRLESDDKEVFESYDTLPDGKEIKVLESVLTRVK